MTFTEIFNEPSLYVGENFTQGVCFEVDKDGVCKLLTYSDVSDLQPAKTMFIVSKNVINQKYSRVYTRQSLFKKNNNETI